MLEAGRNSQIIQQDMATLYLGNLKTVEFDLQLPSKGAYGSDIRWISGDDRFLSDTGKISRPLYGMGNREVELTGIFSCGDAQMEKTYQVTILEQEDPYKEEGAYPIEVEHFDPSHPIEECTDADVRILPGNIFYDSQERMHRYLLSIDDDRMLYHFRKASGLDTKGADSPGGWDAEECRLKGHTTGHYLSALALCYRATGDERIRQKAGYMVEELGKCQKAFSHIEGVQEGFLSGYSEEQFDLLEQYTPYPKIWAPYYTLHKIMAGLLDCWQYTDSEEALAIAEGMGMWTWRRLGRLPEEQLKKMWSMYIAGEFGGMNAVMAQLAQITGKEEFIRCARLFDNDKLFEPLSRDMDCLSGLHANQHIPQVLGALEIYKATGEERYLHIAEAFWATVTGNRSYAPGGVGETEMFHGFREIGNLLTANTQETCASYNMLKLTKELYQLHPDTRYMDYYERTLLNHILATPARDDSGESTYFFPLAPGMKREFLRENSCCHGTGMESHFKYREGIYFRYGQDLYINLYIPSEMSVPGQDLTVRIESVSVRDQRYRIEIRGRDIQKVFLRRPVWADEYRITEEGGKTVDALPDERGYIFLDGDFSGGRQINVQWKPHFQIVRTYDVPEKAAVMYGPFILAALSDRKEFIQVSFDEKDVSEQMRWDERAGEDRIRFQCGQYTWIPLCEIDDQAYHAYVICKGEAPESEKTDE